MSIVEKALKARQEELDRQKAEEQAKQERMKQEDIKTCSEALVYRAWQILGLELDPSTFKPVQVHEIRWTVTADIDGRIFRPYDENGYDLEVYVAENMRPGWGDGRFKNFRNLETLGRIFEDEAKVLERRKAQEKAE